MNKKNTQLRWLAATLMLVAAMVMPSTAWAQITPTKPSGNGTSSSPYQIGTAAELYWFAGLVNGTLNDGTQQNTTAKGVLTGNIDLTSVSNWTPIGNASNKFGGTFDGKNFKVQHLSITQQGYNTGLFGYTNGATMQNICIDGNVMLTTTSYTEGYGSIAGRMDNSTISNCHSSVNFSIDSEMGASEECIGHIGGIVGKMHETNSAVQGCSYSGTINLGNNNVKVAAGIAGYATYNEVPITNCSFTGTIKSKYTGALYIGGIFGYTNSSGEVKVTNCLQAGTLENDGDSSLTGILIGQINNGYGANAVTNNYYTSSTFKVIGTTTGTPTTTPATQCSTKQLQSGEICYLLNGSSPYGEWGQKLGTDSYPVPGSNNTVYSGYKDCRNITYSNNQEELSENPVHSYNNGFGPCSVCGDKLNAYQPATLTTDKYDINGDNTKDEVYEIGNAGQLYWFAGLVNGDPSVCTGGVSQNTSANAVLIANITVNKDVLNANGDLNTGDFTEWTPIGKSYNNGYGGAFDGQGHTISGLWKIQEDDYIGLFGVNNGTIKNIGVVDSYFSGNNYVGGVCGWNVGSHTNCYNTGSVLGKKHVGGVCGVNGGSLTNCYNTGSLRGSEHVGGVCGLKSGNLTNCYYLANVEDYKGGKSEAQFASGEVCYLLNGSSPYGEWGQKLGTDDYPVLGSNKAVYRGYKDCLNKTYSNNPEELSEDPVHHYDNGFCEDCNIYLPATLTTDKYDINGDNTKDNVYEIGNAGQLYWFAGLVNGDPSVCTGDVSQNTSANAVLIANITVNKDVFDANGDLKMGDFIEWTPIGNYITGYGGAFDGQGHTISGLWKIQEDNRIGLFGVNNGTIKNIGVVDSFFSGCNDVGGVCGRNYYGSLTNCYNTGRIHVNHDSNEYENVGGVCGFNERGSLTNCYNTGRIDGIENVGGVCGKNDDFLTNCYNTGYITGNYSVSGVCGWNSGSLTNCYNTGTISGYGNYFGGVCGKNDDFLTNCYNTGNIYGYDNVGGVCGWNGSSLTNCYNTGNVQGNEYVGGVCGRNDRSLTNCYYLANEDDKNGGKEETQFKSGEVAYLLAQGCTVEETFYDGSVWGQQLGENDYPVLGSAYKVLMAARDGQNGTNYWATFSNLNSNAELTASTGAITVYNATVSAGTLTLTKRSDNKVAKKEGVLLKANCEYVNAKNISDEVSAATGENHLVATPATAKTITAETDYTLYRLTYNKTATKEGLGFYLGVVGESKDGTQLKATPGKAYLKVLTSEAKLQSSTAKPARGFAFPGDDDETTGIECITVTDESLYRNGNAEGIFDLQGRKVSKPTKGVYINNGKKVIIK